MNAPINSRYSVGVQDSEGHIVAVLETNLKLRKAYKRLKHHELVMLAPGTTQTRQARAEHQAELITEETPSEQYWVMAVCGTIIFRSERYAEAMIFASAFKHGCQVLGVSRVSDVIGEPPKT